MFPVLLCFWTVWKTVLTGLVNRILQLGNSYSGIRALFVFGHRVESVCLNFSFSLGWGFSLASIGDGDLTLWRGIVQQKRRLWELEEKDESLTLTPQGGYCIGGRCSKMDYGIEGKGIRNQGGGFQPHFSSPCRLCHTQGRWYGYCFWSLEQTWFFVFCGFCPKSCFS